MFGIGAIFLSQKAPNVLSSWAPPAPTEEAYSGGSFNIHYEILRTR